MRALVNKVDNSVSLLEINGNRIPPNWQSNASVFLVEVDDSCIEGIEEQFLSLLFYSPEDNTIYRRREFFVAGTEHSLSFFREELRAISLLPVEARTPDMLQTVQMARRFLPEGVVDEILADDILTDNEISEILSYLNEDT